MFFVVLQKNAFGQNDYQNSCRVKKCHFGIIKKGLGSTDPRFDKFFLFWIFMNNYKL